MSPPLTAALMLDLLEAAIKVEADGARRWLLIQAARIIRTQQAHLDHLQPPARDRQHPPPDGGTTL